LKEVATPEVKERLEEEQDGYSTLGMPEAWGVVGEAMGTVLLRGSATTAKVEEIH
jgi:hypothetical protein